MLSRVAIVSCRQRFGELAALDAADLHRPGYRTVAHVSKQTVSDLDAARDRAASSRAAWIEEMSDAWKMDKRKPPPDDDENGDDDEDNLRRENQDARDPRAAARASYDAMCERIQNAWRTPAA